MKILNEEIDFDFLDADQIEIFEKAAQEVKEKCSDTNIKEVSLSEALRRECQIVNEFFDNVFGKGTSERIFKGKMNLKEHIKAFEDITEEKIKAQKDFEKAFSKYLPNRKKL